MRHNRHSTATLLLKARVPYAIVQRITRHRDPRMTTETYGHLEVDDMRIALDELAEGTAPALSEAVAASNRESFGTHLVPADPEGTTRARVRPANPARTLAKTSGPSRIRTWDQSVIEQRDPHRSGGPSGLHRSLSAPLNRALKRRIGGIRGPALKCSV